VQLGARSQHGCTDGSRRLAHRTTWQARVVNLLGSRRWGEGATDMVVWSDDRWWSDYRWIIQRITYNEDEIRFRAKAKA
jgi:hypothetical protein